MRGNANRGKRVLHPVYILYRNREDIPRYMPLYVYFLHGHTGCDILWKRSRNRWWQLLPLHKLLPLLSRHLNAIWSQSPNKDSYQQSNTKLFHEAFPLYRFHSSEFPCLRSLGNHPQ